MHINIRTNCHTYYTQCTSNGDCFVCREIPPRNQIRPIPHMLPIHANSWKPAFFMSTRATRQRHSLWNAADCMYNFIVCFLQVHVDLFVNSLCVLQRCVCVSKHTLAYYRKSRAMFDMKFLCLFP